MRTLVANVINSYCFFLEHPLDKSLCVSDWQVLKLHPPLFIIFLMSS